MPKSKRFKKFNITKTKKKNRKEKSEIISDIHDFIQKYKYIYVVKLKNQRNTSLKQLRVKLEPGKIFIGKNKLLQVAFGNSPHKESAKNTHKISSFLHGERGLIFTDLTPNELNQILSENSTMEFGREGSISDITCIVEPNSDLSNLFQNAKFYMNKQHPQLESTLQELDEGKILLCEKGLPLSKYQYLIMKYLDIPSVKFEVKPIAYLNNEEITYLDKNME